MSRALPHVQPPAGRQGPGPMPGAAVEALDVAISRRAAGMLPGDWRAYGTGSGTELAQLRQYVPGDDVRRLDPAATARTGTPHVRLEVPERAVTTWLVLDVSASMAFGTAERLKADVAEGATLVLARLCSRRGGRVALLRFGAGGQHLVPPKGGRGAIAPIRKALEEGVSSDAAEHRVRGGEPDALADALVRVGRLAQQRGLVVVVSDFRDAREPWRALGAVAQRHAVVAVEVRDPREESLPAVGHLALVDPETGALLEVDTTRPALRERFAAAERERRAEVATRLRRLRADHIVLSTDGDWLKQLGGQLG